MPISSASSVIIIDNYGTIRSQKTPTGNKGVGISTFKRSKLIKEEGLNNEYIILTITLEQCWDNSKEDLQPEAGFNPRFDII